MHLLFDLAATRMTAAFMQRSLLSGRHTGRAPAGASNCTPCSPGTFSASTGHVPRHPALPKPCASQLTCFVVAWSEEVWFSGALTVGAADSEWAEGAYWNARIVGKGTNRVVGVLGPGMTEWAGSLVAGPYQ